MKLLVFSHTYPTILRPGQGLVIKNELDLLFKIGFRPKLCIPQVFSPFSEQKNRTLDLIPSLYPIDVFTYLSIPKRLLSPITRWFLERSSKKVVQERYARIVHLHWLYPIGILAPYFKKNGYKVVLTIHGTDWHYTFNKPLLGKVIYQALEAADTIITVGKQLKSDIQTEYPELSNKIVSLKHGINTDFFKPSSGKKEDSQNYIQILCVANLFHVKGVDLLLNAFALLQPTNCDLTIISSSIDPEHKRLCESIVTENQLNSSVSFISNLTPTELLDYYQKADFFVLPSRSEAFGLALAEAGACGLPSISTKSGGPEEIMTDETGILVNIESVLDLKDALSTMIETYHLYNTDTIRNHIISNFSLAEKGARLSEIYTNLDAI